MKYEEFLKTLKWLKFVGAMQEELIRVLSALQTNLSDDVKEFLLLLLSCQSEGHTRIPLDAKKVEAIFEKKWAAMNSLKQAEFPDFEKMKLPETSFIPNAIEEIGDNRYEKMIQQWNENDAIQKPLIAFDGYLYPEKYFSAKLKIEEKILKLFMDKTHAEVSAKSLKTVMEKVAEITRNPETKKCLTLEEEQAKAIVRGESENLIITGGPGTGKTTVVFYLLRNLYVKNPNLLDSKLYLAAPSGKASDRMRESIQKASNGICDEAEKNANANIYKKIREAKTFTLHRLLNYNGQTNQFRYNAKNPFEENSIFVIDESSMVDITLFAKFLEALPDSSRIFLLGDKDQLPSVEAGAVLGDLLSKVKCSVNALTKSRRFSGDSKIGKLAKEVMGESEDSPLTFEEFSKDFAPVFENEVVGVELKKKKTVSDLRKLRDEFLKAWCEKYYADYLKTVQKILPTNNLSKAELDQQKEIRANAWRFTEVAKILSAERAGVFGVEELNIAMEFILRGLSEKEWIEDRNFFGRMIIFTKNQSALSLYNGDSGILVKHSNGSMQIMLPDKNTGEFVFYPTSLFSSDAYESAFAITVHKSQGSEYDNIAMFLPTQKGVPLLNRQILYTGITRAKKRVAIISNAELFQCGKDTVIKRDTGIAFD